MTAGLRRTVQRERPGATPPDPTSVTSWLPAFVALAAIWGCSFAFIRLSLDALSPVQVAAGRLLLGASALLGLAAVRRIPLPRQRSTWAHLAVVAALLNAAPFTLFAVGQQHISSVLAGIINAATPLTTLVVILVALPEERPTPTRLAGLAVGFAGVAVLVGAWQGFDGSELHGVLACLAAVTCYGVAFPYVRRHISPKGEPPTALAAAQVSIAAAQMVPVLLVTGVEHDHLEPAGRRCRRARRDRHRAGPARQDRCVPSQATASKPTARLVNEATRSEPPFTPRRGGTA